MSFVLPERTRERTATAGTGDLALLGVLSPNQFTFNDRVGVGNETSYTIVSGDGIGSEEGFGVLTGPTTFQRTTVTKNHLGTTAHIDLSGESRVFVMIPGNLGMLFAKYFGGDFSKQILRYSIVTGQWEATLDNGSWKQSCALATTGPLPANTYANGAAGVGATLTGNVNGQPTIDGVLLRLNYRVLVKDEANPIHNGIYICTIEGDSTHEYQLTRAVDYDDQSDLSEGDCVAIGAAGTANGRTIWTMQTGDTGINIGTTTDVNWFIVAARPNSGLDLFGSAAGDTLFRNSTNWNALAIGTDGQVLTVLSGLPIWADPAGGGGSAVSNAGIWNVGNSYTAGNVARDGADFYQAINNVAASSAVAPDIDGHFAIDGNGTSNNGNLTTTTANDLVCLIFISAVTGTSIASITSELTFTLKERHTNGNVSLELWTAPAPSILTASNITANFSASANHAIYVFAIKGSNGISPFDPSIILPKYSTAGSSITGITTVNLYDLIFYFNSSDNSSGFNPSLFPSGYTNLDTASYIPVQSNLSYNRVSAAQTNITLDAASGTANQTFVFAITSGNAPPHLDTVNWVRMSGFDETAFNAEFGTTRGAIPVKGASLWGVIAPGTAGQIINMGTSGDPHWTDLTTALDAVSATPGALIQRGTGSNWGVVTPGTTGQVLTMQASGLAHYADASGGGGGGGGLFADFLTTTPTLASTGLAWFNQGTATTQNGAHGLQITAPAVAGDSVRILKKTLPAPPYKITALVAISSRFENYQSVGIGFRNGTDKLSLISVGVGDGLRNLGVIRYSNATTYNSTESNSAYSYAVPWINFMQLENDGTNVFFRFATLGDDWTEMYTSTLAAGYLGATGYTEFVFFANRNNNAGIRPCIATLMHLDGI